MTTKDQPEHPEVKTKPRGKPSEEGRFIWISCLAAERIVNELGTDATFGMAVYVALARLAGKEQSPTFETTVQVVAGMARVSYPKTLHTLEALERAKVIAIERREREKGQARQLPHIYTLLSLRLNGIKSARLNAVKPPRLNGAGLTEQGICGSEIPKDSDCKSESNKKEGEASPSQMLASGGASPSFKERTPFNDVGDWGKR